MPDVVNFPVATLRLMLYPAYKSASGVEVPAFGFDEAGTITTYAAEVGISHAYLPPTAAANPGSLHGYDVADHSRTNPELGGEDGRTRFTQRTRETGLKQIVDLVPNHMSTGSPAWQGVLKNGAASPHAEQFDIDWNSPYPEIKGKIMVPVLGNTYESQLPDIKIQMLRGELRVGYWAEYNPPFQNDWPLSEETLAELTEELARDPDALEKINADPTRKDAILQRQNYVLADFRDANQKLNYRPFFDVHGLPALRVEKETVFNATHQRIVTLAENGDIDGVRIDHPDGLRDPREYGERLSAALPQGTRIVYEKILAFEINETLPKEWKGDGTTGYDFLNRAGGLLIDPRNEAALTGIYERFTGESRDYETLCHDNKHVVMRDVIAAQVNRAITHLTDAMSPNGEAVDIDTGNAVKEVIANFQVYRTYVRPSDGVVSARDRAQIDHAIEGAKAHRPDIDPKLFDTISDVLLLKNQGPAQSEFIARFQQVTGPVMAKAVEDTTFYQYNRFLAKNEVGGNPAPGAADTVPATLIQEFHEYCAEVQKHTPRQMNTTSTHDTKRSGDIRARLSVLSEIPERWERAVTSWTTHNQNFDQLAYDNDPSEPKDKVLGKIDRNLEYALYQTMVGSWPISEERMQTYANKAMKEAKEHTSWLRKDEPAAKAYEAGVHQFITNRYKDSAFQASMDAFVAPLAEAGLKNSLSLSLLKAMSPGIPDYFRTFGVDFCNVDPDSRLPVDYGRAQSIVEQLKQKPIEERLSLEDANGVTVWQTAVALAVRQEYNDSFSDMGDYDPVLVNGPNADHIVTQLRGDDEGPKVLAIEPILRLSMTPDDTETTLSLPEGKWRNRFTGDTFQGGRDVRISDLIEKFPTALLVREDVTTSRVNPAVRLLGSLDVTPATAPHQTESTAIAAEHHAAEIREWVLPSRPAPRHDSDLKYGTLE